MKRISALLLTAALLCSTALAAERAPGFDGFTPSQVYDGRFTDVAEESWYYESVSGAYALGLMNGTGPASFSPDGALTVAQALTLACRLLSVYTGDGQSFAGDGSSWYLPYVSYAVEWGLITRTQFSDYDAPATRAQAAAILGALPPEMLVRINSVQDNAIPDVAPGSGYRDAVYTLYRAGIFTGSDKQGSFLPDSAFRRSEAAAIAVRLAEPAKREKITLTAQPVTLYADNGDRITVSPGEAAAYEDLGWRAAPFTVPSSGGAEAILNAATLRPRPTGDESLDKLVDGIFTQILTGGMSTYEKVKACYDYLIAHTGPGSAALRITGSGPYQSFSDYRLVLEAQDVLEAGTGTSDGYSAAFLVMTRRIGLSCYVFSGETAKSGGGYTSHAWNVITVGGTDYVFDVQAEDNLAGGGKIQYYRFCKSFSQVSQSYRNYDAEASKAAFGNFAK